MARVRLVAVLATIAVAAMVTAAAIAVLTGLRLAGPAMSPSPKESTQTSLSTEFPSPSDGAEPTLLPWETPPPDAVAPAGATAIPGIGAATLAGSLTVAGYSCYSGPAGPEMPIGAYVIICDQTKGGASARVIAFYWTNDFVSTVHVAVLPDPLGGEITDSAIVRELLTPLLDLAYTGSRPADTDAWFVASAMNASCATSCEKIVGEVVFALEIGTRGSTSLDLRGTAAKP